MNLHVLDSKEARTFAPPTPTSTQGLPGWCLAAGDIQFEREEPAGNLLLYPQCRAAGDRKGDGDGEAFTLSLLRETTEDAFLGKETEVQSDSLAV